jgi:hypothetical protein
MPVAEYVSLNITCAFVDRNVSFKLLKKCIFLFIHSSKEMMFDILAFDLFFLPIHLIKGEKVENELGITRRPDSDFKRRLIKALTKPVACMRY